MKRFWTQATLVESDGGLEIRLDDRPVRTPRRAPLILPTHALAEAVAAEWQAVEDEVKPALMPLTGMANAAIDHVAADPAHFVRALSAYAETDLLCYRAEHPELLMERQAAIWDPVMQAVETNLGLRFQTIGGVRFAAQPEATLARVGALLTELSHWQLAALQPIVSISGSAILGLALLHGLTDAEAAFAAGALDELWQEEQWGIDTEAMKLRESRRAGFDAAARFLGLLA